MQYQRKVTMLAFRYRLSVTLWQRCSVKSGLWSCLSSPLVRGCLRDDQGLGLTLAFWIESVQVRWKGRCWRKKVLSQRRIGPRQRWSWKTKGRKTKGIWPWAIQRWASWEVSLDPLPFLPAPYHTLYLTLPLSHRYSVGYTRNLWKQIGPNMVLGEIQITSNWRENCSPIVKTKERDILKADNKNKAWKGFWKGRSMVRVPLYSSDFSCMSPHMS